LNKYGLPVDINDPLPPAQEPSAAEADQYLAVLKDAMSRLFSCE
jgi:hypothetical protein